MSPSDFLAKDQHHPSTTNQKKESLKSGIDLYNHDMNGFDDAELEDILSKMSPEELEDLNCDFDPDNSLLPPSQRCRDQTKKTPTGPFDRNKLLKFLEEEAAKEKDWEEVVPFVPGIKRGKVFETKDDEPKKISTGLNIIGISEENQAKTETDIEKKAKGMEMPIEIDLDEDDDDDEEEDTELAEALHKAPERDLVDLAGILGMHNVLNQPQYYNALKGKGQDDGTGTSFGSVIRGFEPRIVQDEPENQTNVEECINKLEVNDPTMKEVNINNMKSISKERLRCLIDKAIKSDYLTKLSMANTAMSDSEARGLIDLLETSPSLKVLNIESNYITPELMAKLIRATLKKQILTEFHAENQRASILGNQIEMDIMMNIEENDSLLRVGLGFQSMEARHRVSEALERNYERLRLMRLEKK
ncbi:FI20012p1 [Strongyloides ratti]|uniref:FI20012p1 n=1 Tax=Strongyloides ratti TaxID=34506 RepID=A0A090L775_STRRB|nr:FI20012p1 [Strongyloides ratti]CEF65582.1 FI20012p1 [Strongyloides ratti]